MESTGVLAGVRVLVAHGDRLTRTAIGSLLAPHGAQIREAAGGQAVIDRVRRDRPHVLLLDEALCRRDGRPLLREITGDPELMGTAVVLLTPDAGAAEIVGALQAGAVDVWASPAPGPELVARVRSAHRSRLLLDLALRRYEDLEDLAYRDELTGLPNRRGSVRRLEVLLSRARRHGHDLTVLLVDADHFKAVNDRHGHAVGDAVLRALAARLQGRLRTEDVAGRWGGEEFVIVLPDTGELGAAALAEDLRAAVAATPVDVEARPIGLSVSIGLAHWAGEDQDALLARADRALYAAKAAGRDRVVVGRGAPVA